MNEPLLQVKDLRVYYHTQRGPIKAVDGVSFQLKPNSRLGLVGESGSGKSTLAMALLQLLKPPARIDGGQILLDGVDLATLSDKEIRQVRLNQISLIPQGAMNSLNPVVRLGDQVMDGIRAHNPGMSRSAMKQRVREVLEWVDLKPEVADMYPHQLSGGMKQRVCIAIAVSLRPKVIIADEPTSALDVVVQRQVMETISRVQQELGASVILIGHDMGLMVQFVERLVVMYAGKVAEVDTIRNIFTEPLHPYTRLLIGSLPTLEDQGVFRGIPGIAPSLLNAPQVCLFSPRCPHMMDICVAQAPALREVNGQRQVACHLYNEDKKGN
jgi:peptide/nickel transport system ATP-binding protein